VSAALTHRADGSPSDKPPVSKLRHALVPPRHPVRPSVRFTCPVCGVTSLFQSGKRGQSLPLYVRSSSFGPVWRRTNLRVHEGCAPFVLANPPVPEDREAST
jgi:hypothetical protein